MLQNGCTPAAMYSFVFRFDCTGKKDFQELSKMKQVHHCRALLSL